MTHETTSPRPIRGTREDSPWLLLFQPQVRAEEPDTPFVGCEALLRARLPDGDLQPAISVLEREETRERPCVVASWCVAEACRQTARWYAMGRRLPVSVNVSALPMQERAFVCAVEAALSETGLSPSLLTLEVTETVPLPGCMPTVRENFARLRAMGVRLMLDNFGTGYASLATLRNLPFTGAKLARAYIRDMGKDAGTNHIVSTLVPLFQTLALDVVATGVETPAQRDALLHLGVPVQQGYLYSPPRLAEAL